MTWLLDGQRAAVEDNQDSIEAVPQLINMISEPERSRTRTVESISMQGRVIGQQVNIEFHLFPEEAPAPGPGNELYIPVLIAHKGEPIDNLVVTDAQNQLLSVLSYEETIKLLAVAVNYLVGACIEDEHGQLLTQISAKDAWQAEIILLQLIYCLKPQDERVIAGQIDRAFSYLDDAGADEERQTSFSWLHEFVTTLSRAYPIIVVHPHEASLRRIVISYRRSVIQALGLSWFRGQMRLALGLRPLKVTIDTKLARISKAYHLQVGAPSSQYLMEQTLRCAICSGPLTPRGVERPVGFADSQHEHASYLARGDHPYYELRGKYGQPYAHLYMRGFAALRREKLVLTASFGETPPGMLASATITAVVSCLLIGAIGHAEATGVGYESDIPALLLALPAAAASWFGFNSDGDAVLRSSLAARCSLLIGGFTSLLAAVVFLVTDRPDHPTKFVMPPSVFGMHLPSWWGLLFCIASANLLCVFAQLLIRSWSYRRLLLR